MHDARMLDCLNQAGQLDEAIHRQPVVSRGWCSIGPGGRERHAPRRTTFAHEHHPCAGPPALEHDDKPLTKEQMERMSDDNRVRKWARSERAGPMPGPLGCRVPEACPRTWG